MQKVLIVLVLVISFWGLSGCDQGAKSVPAYPIEEFLNTTNYARASFSPDKSKILVTSDLSGIYNVYEFPASGGEPKALTQSTKESFISVSYFPEDERFLYSADQGGNELNHLFVQELDGSVQDLTPGEQVKANWGGWAQDGKSFYIETNERDQRYFDLYEYSLDYSRKLIFENEGYDTAAISADKQYLALVLTNNNADSDVFLHNLKTDETTLITDYKGDVENGAQAFHPDSKSLYFLSDLDSEFSYLVRYDIAAKTTETVRKVEWDVSYAYFSKKGTYLMVAVNNDGRTELEVYLADTMERVELPLVENAQISSVSLSADETMVAFYATSSRMPRDLFVMSMDGDKPLQLTHSLSSAIDSDDLVEAEVVRFTSFDELQVPGILYKPHQASKSSKVPALVWVHGGPGGQSTVRYSALIQYLVNHGYAVYAINNRGSSGYGKTFFHLDDQKHGEGDLDDCVTSKKMLIETGWVDPDRIGIIGGSYGGYMVLAALAFRPEAFDVGVDIFGVANWVRTLQSIPPYWESFRKSLEKEMGDFDDVEYLTSISPMFHAQNVIKPIIVLQGANDPRVLQAESDEIVEKIKANNVPVEYVVFDDEGHGFRKKENQAKGYKAILDFLDQHLKMQEIDPA